VKIIARHSAIRQRGKLRKLKDKIKFIFKQQGKTHNDICNLFKSLGFNSAVKYLTFKELQSVKRYINSDEKVSNK
jgi:hypothetical protein